MRASDATEGLLAPRAPSASTRGTGPRTGTVGKAVAYSEVCRETLSGGKVRQGTSEIPLAFFLWEM